MMDRRTLLKGILSFGVAGGALALVGCSQDEIVFVPSDDDAQDIGAVVTVADNMYVPNSVTIAAGQAVHWVWDATNQHDVVAEDRTFATELMYGGEYKHIFTEPGEYPYYCTIHPEMRGTVIVT